jgi:hypothetical protein
MARKSHTNTAKPCQITPKLPFAVEPYHDLLTPAQKRAVVALLGAQKRPVAASLGWPRGGSWRQGGRQGGRSAPWRARCGESP